MRWTKTPPTKEGFYWVQWSSLKREMVVHVSRNMHNDLVVFFPGDDTAASFSDLEGEIEAWGDESICPPKDDRKHIERWRDAGWFVEWSDDTRSYVIYKLDYDRGRVGPELERRETISEVDKWIKDYEELRSKKGSET